MYESQADKLINNLKTACEESILIPNHWLPESYHNKKTGEVGLDTVIAKLDKQDEAKKPSKHQVAKQNRSENIEVYKDYTAHDEPVVYENHVDEAKLYENMQSFAKYCPRISLED